MIGKIVVCRMSSIPAAFALASVYMWSLCIQYVCLNAVYILYVKACTITYILMYVWIMVWTLDQIILKPPHIVHSRLPKWQYFWSPPRNLSTLPPTFFKVKKTVSNTICVLLIVIFHKHSMWELRLKVNPNSKILAWTNRGIF